MLLLAAVAVAQISPGPLARPHAELEGLRNCTLCHELGSGVTAERCLACHGALAARLADDAGWHAQEKVRGRDCAACHGDHHGRDFEMIEWEGGREAFDHGQTGWPLEGAHGRAACDDCHRPGLLPADWLARHPEVAPGRSHLGLRTACVACHADEHGGQFAGSADPGSTDCAACHGKETWQEAGGFDHDRSAYPLDGAHRRVSCSACHRSEPRPVGADAGFRVDADRRGPRMVRYRGLAHGSCTDCHRDPHGGALGMDCAGCHTTASFTSGAQGFDHELTRWPLRGAHATLDCEACHRHPDGTPLRRPAFERCEACHRDPHGGQFARRQGGDDCRACHGMERFLPPGFGLAEHRSWPLEGAHLAVACNDCHRPGEDGMTRFLFGDTRCEACHANPHGTQIAAPVSGQDRCAACHDMEGWDAVTWDHGLSRFPLQGRHSDLACGACHRPASAAGGVRLAPLPTACAGCHTDVHGGQFATAQEGTDCARCHGPADWGATGFDHGRDAAFTLDGAHADLPCAACHRPEWIDGKERVRWKPIPFRCSDCHGWEAP
jgi:hypothetical protein